MKLRGILLGLLATLLLMGAASAAELVLDWPHNEDNGIFCFHCHSEDPETGDDWWITTTGIPTDPDFTVANWVCNRCHAPAGIRTIESLIGGNGLLDGTELVGPTKSLHSSATTKSTKPEWTTQCIDCHDPHFQAQKDWGESEIASVLYIATGKYENAGGALLYVATDDPTDGHLLGPLGGSTRGINVSATAIPVADWIRKGKAAGFETRDEVGGTRGLILVANPGDPVNSRTYEIVKVTGAGPYTLMVNGVLEAAAHGADFGILYGASINKQAITPAGLRKDVKYFNPNKVYDAGTGTYGGPADLTPGETAPVGLCQVCHTATVVFDEATPAEDDAHNDLEADEQCTKCHDILTGGEAQQDHTAIIDGSALTCPTCHVGYGTTPDAGHQTSGCDTCHDRGTWPYPYLDATTTYPRVQAFDGSWVNNTDGTNNQGIWSVTSLDCLDCHNTTYGGKVYTDTGVHPDPGEMVNVDATHTAQLSITPLCATACHGAVADGAAMVSNAAVHNDNCALCHDSIGPPPLPVVLKPGLVAGSSCADCHTASYFGGHLHVSGGAVTHETMSSITDTALCVTCHTALDPMGVHNNNCWNCHSQTDGTRVNGNVNASGYGGVGTNVGDASGDYGSGAGQGGQCTDCHSNYFNGHLHHTINNHVAFNGTAGNDQTTSLQPCSTCHQDATSNTSSLNLWNGILVEHETIGGVPIGGPGCPTCHSYTNADAQNTPTVTAVNDAIANVAVATINCGTCHTVKTSVDHGGHIGTHFAWGGDCDDCHSANPGSPTEEVVLDIHGDTCTLCHFDPDNVVTPGDSSDNYDRIVATDGDATEAIDKNATCLTCHVTATPAIDKPFIHHDSLLTCNSVSCHNTVTTHNADHNGGTPGMVRDQGASGDDKACSSCHDAYNAINITSPADGNNTKVDPADDKVHDACTTCHEIEAVTNIVKLVAAGAPGSIAEAMPIGAGEGGTDGGGTCTACHTSYFEAHLHHDGGNNNFIYNYDPGPTAPYEDATYGAPYYVDVSWDVLIPGPTGCATLGCHDDYFDDGGAASAVQSLDTWAGIKYEHDRALSDIPSGNTLKDGKRSCYNCHNADSRSSGINEAKYFAGATVGDVVAQGKTKNFVNCTDCHFDKKANNVHGLTIVNHLRQNTTAQGSFSYAPIIADPECLGCHTWSDVDAGNEEATDPDDIILGIHKNACSLCHLSQPDLLADAPGGKNFTQFATTDGVSCTECHRDQADLNGLKEIFHGMDPNDAQMGIRHNNLGDSGGAGAADCLACHTEISDANQDLRANEKLVRHMPGFVAANDNPSQCTTVCHAAADSPVGGTSPAATIAAGAGTGGSNQVCENCHVDTGVNAYRLHGMTAADLQSEAVHENIDPVVDADIGCANCHDTTTDQKIIELHTSPKNTDSAGAKTCLTCHQVADEGTLGAAQVITNGLGASVSCADCHDSAGVYLMHGLSFGTGADKAVHDNLDVSSDVSATKNNCAQCHSMAASTDRLDLHSVTGCTKCHNNVTDFATADGVITLAWDDTSPTPAKCQNCHSGTNYTNHSLDEANAGLITLHNQLAPQGGGVTSTCGTSTCHDNNTDAKILAFHGTNDCLICHSSSQPAGVRTVITNGVGGTLSPCELCHSTAGGLPDIAGVNGWYLHANYTGGIDHATDSLVIAPTGGGLSNTESCTSTDCHGGLDLIDAGPTPQVGVHDTFDNASDTYSCALCHDAAGLLIGIANGNGAGSNAECSTCHGAYFDSHSQRVLTSSGHENTPTYYTPGAGEDWTQGGSPCGNCHKDKTPGTPEVDMQSWDGILWEHDLDGTQDGDGACATCHNYNATTFINNQTVDAGHVTTAIATTNGNTCGSCHDDKAQGGPNTVALVDHGGHSAADFTAVALCVNCHTGDVVSGVHGAADCFPCHTNGDPGGLPLLGTAFGKTLPATCTTCHTTYFDSHSHHTAHVTTSVVANTAGPTPITETCNTSGCHDTSGDSPYVNADTHQACSSCHNIGNDTGDLLSVAASKNSGNGGECNVCHDTMFDGHDWGLDTSGTKQHTTAMDITNDKAQAASISCDDNSSCHQDFSTDNTNFDTWEGVLYEHDLSGGKDGVGACVTCHDSAYTDVDTDRYPSATTVQDIIQSPLLDPKVRCLDCHFSKKATATHGGHDATHFPWTAQSSAGKTTCGSSVNGAGCHDDTQAVIGVIHNGARAVAAGSICLLCHGSTAGGDGNMKIYDSGTMMGDPNQGVDSNGLHDDIECVTCHTKTKGEIHHAGTDATGGNCIACHQPNVGQNGVSGHELRADLQMPADLACNYCHLWWTNEAYTGTPVNIYALEWDPNNNPNVDATSTALPTHAISTAAVPINDYAACFACHGAQTYVGSAGTSTQIFPFHGYGSDGNEVITLDHTCFGGGNDCGGKTYDLINFYGAPTVTGYLAVTTHLDTKGRQPGFNSLNSLEPYVSMVKSGSNPGKGEAYGTSSSFKQPHKVDAGQYESPKLTTTTTFDVPWDNWNAAFPTAAGQVNIDTEYDHVNHTDTTETHNVPTVMRSVGFDPATW